MTWADFVNAVAGKSASLVLQEWVGVALYGWPRGKVPVLVLWGQGIGKSTFAQTICRASEISVLAPFRGERVICFEGTPLRDISRALATDSRLSVIADSQVKPRRRRVLTDALMFQFGLTGVPRIPGLAFDFQNSRMDEVLGWAKAGHLRWTKWADAGHHRYLREGGCHVRG